ncbi:DUF5959 family protein [Streptomyces sp. SCA3-4]|uniref:DUF5959 family protein n=1 Tax=Streptomyces sichuanensis TaxID=2871810 RepID=UPI001CE257F0|nr:DUF5959 family protein [Streptomyces sichuanensis]MCA6091338.1 DUF5959 family protein [Streptomyces sichuanensis]
MHDDRTVPAPAPPHELIRLAAYQHDVTVTLTGDVHPHSGEMPYYAAKVDISGDLVTISRLMYMSREDIEEWSHVLDRMDSAFAVHEGEPHSVDWPAGGQDMYLRILPADDPCAIELHDPHAYASVQLSFDLGQQWIETSRARLHAVLAVLERLG